MLKNISSVKLIGILAVLLLVYFGVKMFSGKSRSKSFKEELVKIDTAKVTKLLIDAKQEHLELIKENNGWKVSVGEGKFAAAQKSSVKGALTSLLSIKPSRIVAKKSDKWKDYQVDSAGTRVQVFEGDKNTLDLVVGRFGFNREAMQQQQMMGGRGGMQQFYTYVRLNNEDEVYAADQFMGVSLNTDASAFRNRKLMAVTKDSVVSIQFNYPADSSFLLNKAGSSWQVFDQTADSTSVADYLGQISYLNSSQFVDDVPASALVSPTLSLSIKQNNKPEIMVKAFQHPTHKWIVNSSENPDSYFADPGIVEKLFVSKEKLLTPKEN